MLCFDPTNGSLEVCPVNAASQDVKAALVDGAPDGLSKLNHQKSQC